MIAINVKLNVLHFGFFTSLRSSQFEIRSLVLARIIYDCTHIFFFRSITANSVCDVIELNDSGDQVCSHLNNTLDLSMDQHQQGSHLLHFSVFPRLCSL